jgi:NADH-ubiquinone oxidoreductase chain 5
MMVIGSLSLAGFPFLTGFYSKDVILELACAKYTISGQFAYWLGSICVFFTSYYSFRLLNLAFLAPTSAYKESLKKTDDANFVMAFPLILLAFGSIFIGYLAKDMMIGLGTSFWGNSLFILPKNGVLLESEFISQINKFLPLISTFLGFVLAFFVTLNSFGVKQSYALKESFFGYKIYTLLNKRWFFDKVFNDFIGQKMLHFGYNISFKTLDKGFFEILGPFGISATFQKLTKQISKLQSGMIYHYAVIMLIGLTFIITIVGLWNFIQVFVDNKLVFMYGVTFLFFNYYSHNKGSLTT